MILPARVVAGLDLAGKTCDALGGLYLAYDVFRRHAGPLGLLTRAATYSLILGIPAWLALGAAFGAIAGVGLGALVAFDYWALARLQRQQRSSPLTQSWWSGTARGAALGLAVMPRFGWRFGAALSASEIVLLTAVYAAGWVPTFHFSSGRFLPPRATLRGAVLRAAAMGAGAAAAAAGVWGVLPAERFGALILGLTAFSGLFLSLVVPYVEYWIERAPEAFFIYAGLALLFCGLICDAIPSVLVLLGAS